MQRGRQIYGLLIGIDDYESSTIPRLSGAVADTNAFLQFFHDTLKVPPKNLHVLHNCSATRKAIIDALNQLRVDVRIRRGDAIFIYFAGHGSEIPAPKGWEAGGTSGKIQVIIPHDYCEKNGQEVQAIPDRTIGALLEGIAEKKGNNITVVLDCCHSASGTRGLDCNSITGVRSGAVDPSIHNAQLDRQLWGERSSSLPLHSGLQSHVLLAACSAGELAKETNARGIFTKALLDVFQDGDISNMKYSDIMLNMGELSGQHPQCEGVNQNRYIFSSDELPQGPTLYTPFCHCEETEDGQEVSRYTLNAGSAHGLAIGDEITIYSSKAALGRRPLGTLVIDKIDSFSATLAKPSHVPELRIFTSNAVAVKSRRAQREILRLALPSYQDIQNIFHNPSQDLCNVTFSSEKAHLSVLKDSSGSGKLSMHMTDPRVVEHSDTSRFRNGTTIGPEELTLIIPRAIEYQFELDRTNISHPLRACIQVEFFKLHNTNSPYFEDQSDLSPVDSKNLYQNGEIYLDTRDGMQSMYGIKITNGSSYDIYPQVYYFNPELLSVETAYEPPRGLHGPAVPLLPNAGTLTIGYGSGGWGPFKPPMLLDGQTIQVGFLKIFLFTQSLDSAPRQPRSPARYMGPIRPPKPTWDTILIPVVQRLNANVHMHAFPRIVAGR